MMNASETGGHNIPIDESKSKSLNPMMDNGTTAPSMQFDEIPDECPICHRGIDSRIPYVYVENYASTTSQLIFQCPRRDCLHFFIGYYEGSAQSREFFFSHVAPINPIKYDFSEVIATISPQFIDIYNEASYAEKMQLTNICGVGYRKALEFLIKDYAISLAADENQIEEIKSNRLSDVITNYINNQTLQDTAKRASWLGNDETHYVRKWVDKDLEDLKTLIKLTVRWIEMVELAREFKNQMPN
jgi:hypothetical protein